MQWVVRPKLRDGRLPQVLLQVTSPELDIRHKGLHEFVEGIAVDDGQQVMGLFRIPAGSPEQLVVKYGVVIVEQRSRWRTRN